MASFKKYTDEKGDIKWEWAGYVGVFNGKQKNSRHKGFNSLDEAQEDFCNYRKTLITQAQGKGTTLRDVFDMFIEYKQKRVKQGTIRNYTNAYNSLIRYKLLKENDDLSSITKIQAQNIVDKLGNIYKDASPFIAMLKGIYSYAIRMELLENNPFENVEKPKIQSKKEQVYTKEELSDFLEATTELKNKQYSIFFSLLAYTGMRQGEARALQWKDIEDNVISINKTIATGKDNKEYVEQSAKTIGSVRKIVITDDLAKQLCNLRRNSSDNDFIFQSKKHSFLSPKTLRNAMKQACELAGVEYITLHGLRHTFVSLAIESGIEPLEVAHTVGHNSLDMILKVYDTFTSKRQVAVSNKFQTYIEKG